MSTLAAAPAAAPVALSRSARWRRVLEGLPIRTERGFLAPMHFSQSQERLWEPMAPRIDARQKLWFIVLKGRQMYSSTFCQGLTFVRTMEQPGTHSLVIAQDLDTSHALFDKSKLFYEHLPLPKLKAPRVKMLEFPFPTGTSRYTVISAGVGAKGRGLNQTCVHASEVAFWQHPEFMLGMKQSMPDLDDTIFLIESTANGKRGSGQLFYEEWLRAIGGDSDFIPIFLCWTDMPKYRRRPGLPAAEWTDKETGLNRVYGLDGEQLSWRRFAIQTKCQGDPDFFDQEYPVSPEVAFIASGMPAFDRDAVMLLRAGVRPPVDRYDYSPVRKRFERAPRGRLSVWEDPLPGVPYVIGADTAEALREAASGNRQTDSSGDYAAAQVVNMRTLTQVASIHGHIPPWEFADWLNALGRRYNNAILAVEINNHGHTTQGRLLKELYYPNLHRWQGKPDRFKNLHALRRVYGWECVDPDARILTEDLRWKAAGQLKIGDRIMGCQEYHTLPSRVRGLRLQTITERKLFVAPMVEVVLANGARTRVSETHPFLAQRYAGAPLKWVEAKDLQVGYFVKYLPIWDDLRSYDAGRLSGFLDGEGHLSQGKPRGLQMLISQAEGPTADEIRDLWISLGFDTLFKWVRHKKRPQEKPVATCGVIRLPEILRALGSLRPTRLLRRFVERVELERLSLRPLDNVAVQEVRHIGEGPVIGLTTDPDHTLIADGIVGHNTNSYSRPIMIDAGRRVINTGLLTVREEKLIAEMDDFSMMDNGKYEAEYGHDDRIIALLIALRSREENYSEHKPAPVIAEDLRPTAVRILEARDVGVSEQRRRISRILQQRVKQSVRHWMSYLWLLGVLL